VVRGYAGRPVNRMDIVVGHAGYMVTTRAEDGKPRVTLNVVGELSEPRWENSSAPGHRSD
jgi:hypothetical protein